MQIRLTKDEWLNFADSMEELLDIADKENWADETSEEQLEGSVWAILDLIGVNLYTEKNTAYDFDEAQVLKFEQYQTTPFDLHDIVGYFKGCNFEEVGINFHEKTLTIYA